MRLFLSSILPSARIPDEPAVDLPVPRAVETGRAGKSTGPVVQSCGRRDRERRQEWRQMML